MIDPVPLIVDLDGTLIDGDTLHLSLWRILRERAWVAPLLPFAVFAGRARFKSFVSEHVTLEPASLPYRADVIAFVKGERPVRRQLVLATAAHRSIAESVASYLGLFDTVIATDAQHNAKGDGKVVSIRAAIGDAPFDYIGDSVNDVPVFRAARRSYLVCPSAALASAVRDGCRVHAVFDAPRRA